MSEKIFEVQIETIYQRLDVLRQKAALLDDSGQAPLDEAIESLSLVLEELEVAGEELVQQNDELAAAYGLLEVERQRYRELFEFAPDGYLVTDGQGLIQEANQAAINLLQFDLKFVLGKPLTIYVEENDRRAFRARLNRLNSGLVDHVDDWEIWLQPRHGASFPASITVSRVPNGASNLLGLRWLFRDISKRVQAEAAEHEQRLYAEALRQAISTLNSSLDLEKVLDSILENVKLVIPYQAATVMSLEDHTLRLIHWQGLPNPTQVDLSTFRLPLSQNPTLATILATGQSSLIEAVTLAQAGLAHLDSPDVYTWLATPIRIHEAIVGFLNLYGQAPTHYTPGQVQQVQAFADEAGIALTNAQLYASLKDYSGDLEQRVAERTRELIQSKAEIEVILNSSSDAIVLLDSRGIIQQVNQACGQFFQAPPTSAIGQPLAHLAKTEDASKIHQAIQAILQTKQAGRLELELHDQMGQAFFADIAFSPVENREGQPGEIVCSIRDMTQRKLLESSLRQMLERELELSRLKTIFIQTVSHEFRTPLSLILLSSESLRVYWDKLSSEQQTKKFAMIEKGVRRLTEMMEHIVLLSEAESVSLLFNPIHLNLETFCKNLLADMEAGIGDQHEFLFERVGDATYGNADDKLLSQVLSNLLSNAVKYSPTGSLILLTLNIRPEALQFQVRDEGIGITPTDRHHIFDAFYRGENFDPIEGIGLGLTMAKQALELQGGTITFESEPGQGSTFTISIPQKIS